MQPGQMAYDRGSTVFSPDGRLFQVEYAREAVKKGSTTIGIKYDDGVMLIVDRRVSSKLLEPKSTEKIHEIDDYIGCATSGLVADARILVDEARKQAQIHRVNYGENIGVEMLVKKICDYEQNFTQYGGVRPFGTALLVAGTDDLGAHLFETDPSGALVAYKATGIGNGRPAVMDLFEKEFEEDLLVIDYAVKEFGLMDNLKLSIHSGSDKFSIYPIMGRLIRKYDKGIHIKTAGTTWLEENIGLAVADPEALKLAKKIYVNALGRMEELTVPYATVIDVDVNALPSPETVEKWDADTYARTMRHNQDDPLYNPSFRQLIHVSYKIAAELGDEYYPALERHSDVIAREVIENICDRHIKRLFDK